MLWTVYLSDSIITMSVMDHRQKGFKAIMVALNNGDVQVYRDKYLIDTIKTDVSLIEEYYAYFTHCSSMSWKFREN